MSSQFYELVQSIRARETLDQKIDAIVSALEQLENSAVPFCRTTQSFEVPLNDLGQVTVGVTNSRWMLAGQRLVIGDLTTRRVLGYFIVDQVLDERSVVLARVPDSDADVMIYSGAVITPGIPDFDVDRFLLGKADINPFTGRVPNRQAPASATELPQPEFDALMADPEPIGERYQPGHIIYTADPGAEVVIGSWSVDGIGIRAVVGAHDFELGDVVIVTDSRGDERTAEVTSVDETSVTYQILYQQL